MLGAPDLVRRGRRPGKPQTSLTRLRRSRRWWRGCRRRCRSRRRSGRHRRRTRRRASRRRGRLRRRSRSRRWSSRRRRRRSRRQPDRGSSSRRPRRCTLRRFDSRRHRSSARRHPAHRTRRRRRRRIGHIQQFHVENQIGFRRNPRMIRTAVGNGAGSISQLPWNEDASLAAHLHAAKPLVEARNRVANSLMKWKRRYVAQFRFAVVAHHWLAILVLQRSPRVVAGRVKLDPIRGPVPGIEDLEHLARLGHGPGADLDLLVAQRNGKDRMLNSLVLRNVGWCLDHRCDQRRRRGGRMDSRLGGSRRSSCRGICRFGRCLSSGGSRARRQYQNQSSVFHRVLKLQ